ncbi:MAG: IS4 family transposase, partial [Nitrospirales bacterium]|nr:IS4 family transposase [Nitrospirales bacterium]
MNIGTTLFAQLMDFLPWKTFHRLVDRDDGDRYVKSMTCANQFRVMAFAQLTYRESLRDIEVCLSAQSAKLYHMGVRQEVKRPTLADAHEARDWRIHAELAQRLIEQARKLYGGDSVGLELQNTAYALDSTTIDLWLSLFPWALFRTTKSAVKMQTLLDLRGNIPSFIHLSDGKLGDVNVLDILLLAPGAIYVMDRGYLDFAGCTCCLR